MHAIHSLLIGPRDRVTAEAHGVVITGEDGTVLSLLVADALTAHRLEAVFASLRERMAADKAARMATLGRVEAA